MRLYSLQKYLKLEATSAVVLLLATATAILLANSPVSDSYQRFVSSSLFIVNEGLMTLFFFVVGLELKRSFNDGIFSKFSDISLAGMAAIGGMLIPALIYYYINRHNPLTLAGWAIPVATDIAFAVGILSLFSNRIPIALKLFLLMLAIFDDVGAIIIITLFYSHDLSWAWLFIAGIIMTALFFLNHFNSKILMFYLLLGTLLWLAFLKAQIHPTISGVIIALFIPDAKTKSASLLRNLEGLIHPWVAYFVMPLFALINAGIILNRLSWDLLTDYVLLGVALGLFVGKQCGVFLFSWLMIKFKFAKLPAHTTWLGLYGVALMCGIGFTMSLFLGTLSFPNQDDYLAQVRYGVIIGSGLSGLMGAIVLALFNSKTSSRRG